MVAENIIAMLMTGIVTKLYLTLWQCFRASARFARRCGRYYFCSRRSTPTFCTYFSLDGESNIDSDDEESYQAEVRHHNLNSYFDDEEDGASSPSGGEEVEQETQDSEEYNPKEELPLDILPTPSL